MTDCFRPRFTYQPAAPAAHTVWELFTEHFRYLPEQTSEPDPLSHMVQKLIYEQLRDGFDLPHCPRHTAPMVILGKPGVRFVKLKRKLSIDCLGAVGKDGSLIVASGLLRCTWPGCFLVAPITESATMRAQT